MILKASLTCIILGIGLLTHAQQTDSVLTSKSNIKKHLLKDDLQKSYYGQGTVTFNCDTLLDSLFVQEKIVNLQQGTKGYRVQLYKSNSAGSLARKEAYAISARYRAIFPNGDPCYTFFDTPFWIVHVGNYREHHQALKTKKLLEKALKDIQDNISVVPNVVIDTKKK